MKAEHLVLLVEEVSMEVFLRGLLPRLLPRECTFEIASFQGKPDLLKKLPSRLRAYARWLPSNWRIVVLLDRDTENCHELKARMEAAARDAGLATPSGSAVWRVANRIAIEELEAWYFGDWEAVKAAYPKVSANVPFRSAYRAPEEIRGGTWEAFERVMRRAGYFSTGLRKVEAARAIAPYIEATRNRAGSFGTLVATLKEATESIRG